MYGRYAGRKFGRARHLLGFSRFLRGNAIGNGQEEDGADDIAQGDPQEVVAVAGEANSHAGRILNYGLLQKMDALLLHLNVT